MTIEKQPLWAIILQKLYGAKIQSYREKHESLGTLSCWYYFRGI